MRDELLVMLRALLADRFHLVLRKKAEATRGYEMVVAKGGLKIQADPKTLGAVAAMVASYNPARKATTGRPDDGYGESRTEVGVGPGPGCEATLRSLVCD